MKHECEVVVHCNGEIIYRFGMTADGDTPIAAINHAIALYKPINDDCIKYGRRPPSAVTAWYNGAY